MKRLGLIIFVYFLLFSAVICIAGDPGEPDTIWVGNITVPSVGNAILPVCLFNDSLLSGAQVVLGYDTLGLAYDSISLVGSRLENIGGIVFQIVDSANLINFAALGWDEYIPPDSGLLFNIFFDILPPAAGTVIPIDSTSWPLHSHIKETMLSDKNANTYIPQFVKGSITVLEAPPTFDSVWVDSVGAMAGDQVAIGIYGKNEEDISKIDLTLSFSSDNLLYNDVTFDQSRSLTAQRVEEANQGQRNIHIGLDFGEDTPLTPGRGLLATVLFDIELSAQDELVVIDSTSYLVPEGQSLEFHQTSAAGGQTFAPYFTAGYVDIKSATDAGEEDEFILPNEYSLAQNNPNPFNPSTKIQFELPRAGHIRLTVFNVLGQTVRTLCDEKLPGGKHSVIFDGKNNNGGKIASGIYFYRLEAGDFTQSKKMILLK